MKILTKIFAFLILILIFSCNNDKYRGEVDCDIELTSIATEQEEVLVERKLIKEGNIEFETDDIAASRKLILESIEKHKGYTSSDEEYKTSGRISNTIEVRVPANSFDQFLSDATKGVSKFDSKTIEIKDVTEEFVDVQARLKVKKELETRYLELLKKANSVTEILEVEKQIGQLRSEIESTEGRLRYLQSKVSLSTLTITFYQSIANETEFASKFKKGFKNGWNNLIWFFVFMINVWPFILIGIGIIFGFKLWRKKRVKS